MLITIGSRTKGFMKTLDIENYPFTESALKSAFRAKIKIHHEDKSDDSNAKAKSQKIIKAYNELKNIALSDDKKFDGSKRNIERKEDLFDLTEECYSCNGTGQKTNVQFRNCTHCDQKNSYITLFIFVKVGTGIKTVKCRACRGTGRFTLRSGREVECKNCSGTGKYKFTCKYCNGVGQIKTVTKTECRDCEGTGRKELKLYNPVIPKGAVL